MIIEQLEQRQFLSAVFYDADSASINIRGTRGDDQITIARHNGRYLVQLNGQRRWFDAKPVQSVQIESFAGDDLIDLHHIALRTQSYTRDGNDTVQGGMGDDYVRSGDGADRLVGGDGHDDLGGEGGADRLIGESGRDTLTGDGGADQLSGGGGDDYLIAASGVDRIDGGPGADSTVRYADRSVVTSVESETYLNTADSPDPSTHLSIRRTKTGVISVVVTTTHSMGGWKDHFEEMTREGDTFTATVFGEDLAGPDGGRLAAVIVDQHVYRLGKLADGVYTFNATSPRQVLAAMSITIANGVPIDPPTWTGPYGYPSPTPYVPNG